MPAGVSWGTYLKAILICGLSAIAGSQTVHLYYRPLDDLDELVKQEKQRILQAEHKEKEVLKNP